MESQSTIVITCCFICSVCFASDCFLLIHSERTLQGYATIEQVVCKPEDAVKMLARHWLQSPEPTGPVILRSRDPSSNFFQDGFINYEDFARIRPAFVEILPYSRLKQTKFYFTGPKP